MESYSAVDRRQWQHLFPILILLALTLAISASSAQAQAPGLPQRPYGNEQLFRVMGTINKENGAPSEHSSVVFHHGYVVEVYSEENTQPRAGIAVFDFADPTAPAPGSPHRAKHGTPL